MDTREAIQNVLGQVTAITGIRFTVSEEVPDYGSVGRLYFVASTGLMNDNLFDVYVYLDDAFHKILTEISLDLTGYVYKDDLTPISNYDIEQMFDEYIPSI